MNAWLFMMGSSGLSATNVVCAALADWRWAMKEAKAAGGVAQEAMSHPNSQLR